MRASGVTFSLIFAWGGTDYFLAVRPLPRLSLMRCMLRARFCSVICCSTSCWMPASSFLVLTPFLRLYCYSITGRPSLAGFVYRFRGADWKSRSSEAGASDKFLTGFCKRSGFVLPAADCD